MAGSKRARTDAWGDGATEALCAIEVEAIRSAAACANHSAPTTVRELLRRRRAGESAGTAGAARLTTACPELDAVLGGGLPTGAVVEIVGESNCGKTQLCLQLLLSSQWAPQRGGLGGRSLYIHTEHDGPLRRLRELAEFHADKGFVEPDACDRIFVEKCGESAPALLGVLVRARALLRRFERTEAPVRLLIVDSIANLFRDFGEARNAAANNDSDGHVRRVAIDRSRMLYQIARTLRQYAAEFGVCVVVTNHVVDRIAESGSHEAQRAAGGRPLASSGREVLPSLGLPWAQCIQGRYFVGRTLRRLDARRFDTSGVVRRIEVLRSPPVPRPPRASPVNACAYVINKLGVWGLPSHIAEESEGALGQHVTSAAQGT